MPSIADSWRALAPECVREVPGGHDWPAWRRLWGEFLTHSKAALR
jgi:enterochelin esterase-like enzyme